MNNIELINFTELNLSEVKMVLKWRNNPDVRKWMYNQDEILLENHLAFIKSLKSKKDKLYFLVKKNNEYIGVIDFNNIKDQSLIMGIYTNPSIKGFGKILLANIINYSFDVLKVKKIFSEVFSENTKAYELYKKYNFIKTDIKIVNNKEVICMELKNENR